MYLLLQRTQYCEKGCAEKRCFLKLSIETIAQFRIDFWGSNPSRDAKRHKIQHAIRAAADEFNRRLEHKRIIDVNAYKQPLVFVANGDEMCEKSYVNLLGLGDSTGFKIKLWNEEISNYFGKLYSLLTA